MDIKSTEERVLIKAQLGRRHRILLIWDKRFFTYSDFYNPRALESTGINAQLHSGEANHVSSHPQVGVAVEHVVQYPFQKPLDVGSRHGVRRNVPFRGDHVVDIFYGYGSWQDGGSKAPGWK